MTSSTASHTDLDAILRDIIHRYEMYGEEGKVDQILAAYEYAQKAHTGILRKSGDPYIVHPLSATQELMILQPDSTTIIATLLHDTVSHGHASYEEIQKHFGSEVRAIVERLDTMSHIRYRGGASNVDRTQKMLFSVAEDIRTLFVKMAERIHNLRTIQYHEDQEKSKQIAEESLFIYAPIAARLGLYSFKDTLETLSFRALDLDSYLRITGELAHYTLEQEEFLTQSIQKLKSLLPPEYHQGISYRIKKPYSIYRKMQERSSESVFDMYDIFAIRIIAENITDCYAVLGHIHGSFSPVPGRFKDFIAVPKLNGYKSLHTTVLGLASNNNQPIEIQIRTKEMDYHAENGIAAHVLYKQFGDSTHKKQELQNVLSVLADGLMEPSQTLGKKIHPTIFVLTPQGDIRELPQGATPVDFAYSVHSDIGYHMTGARINGRIVTLDTKLRNGDMVDIITHTNAHPSAQWLDFVISSKARTEIGVEIKKLSGDRERGVQKGREILIHAFLEKGIALDPECKDLKKYVDFTLDIKKLEEMLYQIGQGIRKPSSFFPHTKLQKTPHTFSHKNSNEPHMIIIGGEKKVPHVLAQCCGPQFPDEIVAVMRSGGKCMVHASNCKSLNRVNPARLLPAYWSAHDTGIIVSLTLVAYDRPGLIADITQAFYQAGVNIVEMHTNDLEKGMCEIATRIGIPSDEGDFLERLKARIHLSIPDIREFR
ncbi:MAG: RelA/SpoT family protein [Candidatus Gracilibacteria bacterium]